MSGRDGNSDFAAASVQIRASSSRMSGKDGVSAQVNANAGELSERAYGTVFAVLVIVSLISLTTDYAVPVIAVSVAIAGALAGRWLWNQTKMNRARQAQISANAQHKA